MLENVTKSLRANQRYALETLLSTGSVSRAAEAASVTEKTIYAWKRQPEFSAALVEAEGQALAVLSGAFVSAGPLAMAALVDDLTGQDKRLRQSAYRTYFGYLAAIREMVSFEERLAALEAKGK